MKTYCKDYLLKNHSTIDLSEDISCCLFLLIEKYNESNNNSSKKEFSFFLLHTLNYYLKDKNYKIKQEEDLFIDKEQISLSLFCKFIDILIHYSVIFIKLKKIEYAKFILSVGVDIINKSDFKNEKKIIKRKISLGNNICCVYILSNNYIKAEIFLLRCKEKSLSNLNKLIIYNNCCIVNIRRIKNHCKNKNELNKCINNIKQYLNLIFNDINKRIENKYKSYINLNEYNVENKYVDNHKNELFCFLIYNYNKIIKILIRTEFEQNYFKFFNFIQKLLGNHHYITLKMKRLEDKNNNDEFINLLLNDNFNDFKDNLANKDIISYIKNNDNEKYQEQINEKKNDLKIERRIDIEIKRNDEIIKKEEIINNNNKNNNETTINEMKDIKKEKTDITDKNLNLNNKSTNIEDKNKNQKGPGQKKTWRGLFQNITGKKAPGQSNKLSELFKAISEAKNNKTSIIEDVKSQYNKYHEEMESYLKDKTSENYFNFNKNYTEDFPENLIICKIEEDDEEKIKFDKITFEKSLQKEIHKKHNSNFIINYFKNTIRKQIIFPELIVDILDYDILEKMNNLYSSKKKNELSINKEIERIINCTNKTQLIKENNKQLNIENVGDLPDENQKTYNNKIETQFFLDTEKYIISYINDYKNQKILININKSKSNQSKKDNIEEQNTSNVIKKEISYDDINYYYSKYYLKNNNEFCINLRYMHDINFFIVRILLHYIRLIKEKENLYLAFCKFPKGNFKNINKKGRPEFTFLNEKCTFELCKYYKKTELNIYNLNYTSYLTFILEFDFSSESVFFQGDNKKHKKASKSFSDYKLNPNYKIFQRLSNLFIKLEKICQFRDKNIKTFSEYAEKYKTNIHKISSTDSMINLDLWIINLQNSETMDENKNMIANDLINNNINTQNKTTQFQWNVELYSLTKLAIKNDSFYINKNIILTQLDFENTLGCDYSDIYTIIDDKDNSYCLYFLLGTIQKMKHLLIKMLNSSNYLTAFRLQKINPVSFFKYKFVFKHIKRYFVCSLEFLIYSREVFFLRIMVMESITNRSYSKIYIPFYTVEIEFDIKEMEKFLKEKYSVINSLYENKIKLKKFLLEESQNLLTKNSAEGPEVLILFENIEFLVEKIKIFLDENKM